MTIDDDIITELKETAYRDGKPFKRVVNETLRAGIAFAQEPKRGKRYRIKPASLGGVRPGIDLAKALRLSDGIEDEEIRRKLEARK